MKGIEWKNVTKTYGEIQALDHVSLRLEPEKIYGLLGRNGAGKTTLLNTACNRIFPEEGEVTIDGLPALENDKAQGLLYMMSEQNHYPEGMRISEVFRWTEIFYDGAFDHDYAKNLSEAFTLNTKKKVKELSTGYNSIFKIITALSLRIPYLLLDEPVLGLDANHRELLYRILIQNYAEYPRTIVLSTHLIEEISSLIEEVVIIKEGKIIVQTASEDLLRSGYAVSGPAGLVDEYVTGREILGQDILGGLKTVYLRGSILRESLPAGLEISPLDLQKLFIQMTNQ